MTPMSVNEKRLMIVGGIIAGAVVLWLLLQRSGGIVSPSITNITPGGFAGGNTDLNGGSNVFNIGAPGDISFSYPTQAGSADGAVPPCNCPSTNMVYYGNTTDQAAGPASDLLTQLGSVLNSVLPPPGYGPGSILKRRVAAYKSIQAEYNTPEGSINAAFTAMNLG